MVRTTLAFVLLALTSTSAAFVDPPTAVPSIATPDQIVSIQIRSGECDVFIGGPDDAEISLTNNVVNVVLDGAHSNSPFCTYPTFTSTFHLGAYSEGEYTVNVYHRYLSVFGTETALVGSTTFIVTGTNVHHSIPASSDASAFILLLAIALTGVLAARHRAF